MLIAEKKFMRMAIEEAIKARERGDYCIGAVIVRDGEVIARSSNRSKFGKDATLHAEVAVIRDASRELGNRYLEGCILYTTHEPCPMCATAAVWARVAGVVSGTCIEDMAAYRKQNGNGNWKWRTINIPAQKIFEMGDPKVELTESFMRDECRELFHSE